MTLKFGMQHRGLEYYQFYSKDDPGLTFTYFTARSDLVSYAFIWEKGKTVDFSETTVEPELKVTPLCTWRAPHVHIKCTLCNLKFSLHCIVVYDLKLATDGRSDKKFLLTSKLCPPGGCMPLPWGYVHVLNHEKNV